MQNAKCAMLGVDIAHVYGQPNTMSVDRIDSSKGYVEGNVQLVCQFVNRGKNDTDNQKIVEFFDLYYNTRKEREDVN